MAASLAEIARLGEVLRAFAAADGEGFDALFDPLAPRVSVAGVDACFARPLAAAGFVAGDADALRGLHRIRRIGARLYVLELGDGPEYVQDVWPETDALLALVDGAPPGRLADVGTGSGVIAIEAAARGHHVVATDLFDTALALARFNAALNGVDLELRQGHLFAPLGDRRFDLVLTAPHYGHEFDQLRLEVLRDGPDHVADGGTLALATALEWQDDGPLAVEPILRARRDFMARVVPIESDNKRHWFARAVGDSARVPSRARFLVTLTRAPEPQPPTVTMPAQGLRRPHVALSRLQSRPSARGAAWVVASADDVAALSSLLAQLAAPELQLVGPLPALLLDACRYGARPCVAPRGQAAGAILDVAGGVRPCAHGEPLGRAEDSLATLVDKQRAAALAAAERRGCAGCSARDVCSRCLFPAGFVAEPSAGGASADADRAYCDFIRAQRNGLPRLRRLVETLARLDRAGVSAPLTIQRWPRRAWSPPEAPATLADEVGSAWNQSECWLVAHAG
ncbi:MAG TPA: methyltransferase, partial [Polyangia bacterium]|nr:methyltransferase [Polyangia bacterium]